MKINQENASPMKPKINRQAIKIQSFIEITLVLVLIVSICIANFGFSDIFGIDHTLILKAQKHFYSFATSSFSELALTLIDLWIFHPDSVNSLMAFLYFSFAPFIAFKFTIIFNISLAVTGALNLVLYMQPRPFWVFPDIHGYSCSENLSGFSEISYAILLITLVLVFHLLKFHICSVKISTIILLFGIFLTLFHAFLHYVQGRLFIFQILSSILWSIISYIFIRMSDRNIDSISFKLGFVNRKSKKWKIYCLCYIAIIYFFIIIYISSIDSNTLIYPIYLHNYFLKCKYDSQFLNRCLLKIHETLSYIIVIPLISLGSSYIYTNYYNFWFRTGFVKKILRGVIVYTLMKLILYSKKIVKLFKISLLSEMLFSGLFPLITGFVVCYFLCAIIFDKTYLFRKKEDSVLILEEERIVNINEKLIINQ